MGFCCCPNVEPGAPFPAIFGERGIWNSRIAGEAQEKIYTLCWETEGKAEQGPWEAESRLGR